MTDIPKAFRYWPDYAKDVYLERVAIMHEGWNLVESEPPPLGIVKCATECAENEIKLVKALQ